MNMAFDSKKLLAEVRENMARLNDCTDHQFGPIPKILAPGECPPRMPGLGQRYRCTRCMGEVDGIARHWYEKGRSHEHESPSKSPLGNPS